MKQIFEDGFVISFKNLVQNNMLQHKNFSLLLLSLHGLTEVNCKYGVLLGDRVFNSFARMLSDCTRYSDQAFRYGKDEFTIILNDPPIACVDNIIGRIQKAVLNNFLMTELDISYCVGRAYCQEHDDFNSLLERAERALLQAQYIKYVVRR